MFPDKDSPYISYSTLDRGDGSFSFQLTTGYDNHRNPITTTSPALSIHFNEKGRGKSLKDVMNTGSSVEAPEDKKSDSDSISDETVDVDYNPFMESSVGVETPEVDNDTPVDYSGISA